VTPRDNQYFAGIQNQLANLGLTDKDVVVTGRVSDEELSALYSRATALVSPSFYEGFGLPALEAMQFGTPVVASDRSSLPEVVGDAGLLFNPWDVEDITRAMKRIVTDPQLRMELSARCSRRSSLFTVERQAKSLLAVYGGHRLADVAPPENGREAGASFESRTR
jgi:glycosyltransferase involved in cell wall biosynthesis